MRLLRIIASSSIMEALMLYSFDGRMPSIGRDTCVSETAQR
jgi:hypothetical protein